MAESAVALSSYTQADYAASIYTPVTDLFACQQSFLAGGGTAIAQLSAYCFNSLLPIFGSGLSYSSPMSNAPYYSPLVHGDFTGAARQVAMISADDLFNQMSKPPSFIQGQFLPLIHVVANENASPVLEAILNQLDQDKINRLATVTDGLGRTPIHIAFMNKDVESIKVWAKAFKDEETLTQRLSNKDAQGLSPVHYAAMQQDLEVFKALFSPNDSSWSSLWSESKYAIKPQDNIFLATTSYDENVLHLAIKNNDIPLQSFLMTDIYPKLSESGKKSFLLQQNVQNETPFSLALAEGKLHLAHSLFNLPDAPAYELLVTGPLSEKPFHKIAALPHSEGGISCYSVLQKLTSKEAALSILQVNNLGRNVLAEALATQNLDNAYHVLLRLNGELKTAALEQQDTQGMNSYHHLASLPANKRQFTSGSDIDFFSHHLSELIKTDNIESSLSTLNAHGKTPIHLALEAENSELANLYLGKYLSPNALYQLQQLLSLVDTQHELTLAFKNTVLHTAAQYGNSDFIVKALQPFTAQQRFHFLNQRNSNGETVLHVALKNASSETIRETLHKVHQLISPANWASLVQAQDDWGNNILHDATGKADIIEFLSQSLPSSQSSGPNTFQRLVIQENHDGQTPIHLNFVASSALELILHSFHPVHRTEIIERNHLLQLAYQQGRHDLFIVLINSMTYPHAPQAFTSGFKDCFLKNEVLESILASGQVHLLDIILTKDPSILTDYKNSAQSNILHLTARNKLSSEYLIKRLPAELVEQLLAQKNANGQLPHEVARKDVRSLFIEKLPTSIKSDMQRQMTPKESGSLLTSPLFYINLLLMGAITEKLRRHFFGDEWTPLHHAAKSADLDTFSSVLAEHSNHLDTTTKDGLTPLAIAIRYNNESAIDSLIRAGATVNPHKPYHSTLSWLTYPNWTPLHFAAKNGSPELIKYLLQQGADVKRRDGNGQTALDIAQQYEQTIGVTTLLSLDSLWQADDETDYDENQPIAYTDVTEGASLLPLYQDKEEEQLFDMDFGDNSLNDDIDLDAIEITAESPNLG